jgi:hypothetical protein
VGFALTLLQRRLASSPQAIYKSLYRRHERLKEQLREAEMGQTQVIPAGPTMTPEDIEEYEDGLSGESETATGSVVDQATAAQTIAELRAEIAQLAELAALAEAGPGLLLGSMWNDYANLEKYGQSRVMVCTLKMLEERFTQSWLDS